MMTLRDRDTEGWRAQADKPSVLRVTNTGNIQNHQEMAYCYDQGKSTNQLMETPNTFIEPKN